MWGVRWPALVSLGALLLAGAVSSAPAGLQADDVVLAVLFTAVGLRGAPFVLISRATGCSTRSWPGLGIVLFGSLRFTSPRCWRRGVEFHAAGRHDGISGCVYGQLPAAPHGRPPVSKCVDAAASSSDEVWRGTPGSRRPFRRWVRHHLLYSRTRWPALRGQAPAWCLAALNVICGSRRLNRPS